MADKATPFAEIPGDQELTDDQLEDLLQHDPFEGEEARPDTIDAHATKNDAGKAETEGEVEGAPETTPPAEAPVAEAKPETETPPLVAPAAAPVAVPSVEPKIAEPSEVQLLRAQVDQQGRLIQAFMARTQSPVAAPTSGVPPAEDEVKVPDYNFNVPENLVEALANENAQVRRGALSALIQGTAQAVHREVIKAMRAEIPGRTRAVVREEQAANTGASNVFEDFYSKHPQFKTQEGMAIVGIASQEVMKETGLQDWSPTLRDAIAVRAQKKLQALVPGMVAAPVAAPPVSAPPKAPPRQPASFAPGARPAAGKSGDIAQQVADMLGV